MIILGIGICIVALIIGVAGMIVVVVSAIDAGNKRKDGWV